VGKLQTLAGFVCDRVRGTTLRQRLPPGLKSHPAQAPGKHFSLGKKKNLHTVLQSKIKESSIMKKLILTLSSAFVMFGLAFPAAAAPRVFVSGFGSNTHAGTLASPVRQIQKAMTLVDSGGEIIILDSANYNPVTINKPVTIVATGVQAEIEVISGDGITVTAGASDVVILRGLTIHGLGGAKGLNFTAGAALHVESCVISGFGSTGILATASGQLFVKDTISRENFFGLNSTAGNLSIDHARLEGNSSVGLFVQGGKASIRDSVASGNGNGIVAQNSGTQVNVESCLVANNFGGIASTTSATVRVSNSTVTNNNTGLVNNAFMETRGNNTVRGNTTNVSGNPLTADPGT
jgi:parallel beta helix pectate lyase-like protein